MGIQFVSLPQYHIVKEAQLGYAHCAYTVGQKRVLTLTVSRRYCFLTSPLYYSLIHSTNQPTTGSTTEWGPTNIQHGRAITLRYGAFHGSHCRRVLVCVYLFAQNERQSA